MKVIRAPGGTLSPLMLDFAIMLSLLKVKAECWKPANDIEIFSVWSMSSNRYART